MVILGALGDLTHRKLVPALAHLLGDGLLPEDFAVLGVARHRLGDEEFRERLRDASSEGVDPALWPELAPRLHYVGGDLSAPATYRAIADRLAQFEPATAIPRGRLFYLAIPPSAYPMAIQGISESGLAPRQRDPTETGWVRVIIEKPLGRSLETARELNRILREAFAEHQIYRIDHYLGKETVQNLSVLRFANSIFEPVWNRNHIHHVQITAAETLGVEHRASYYEEAGVVRDMFQNHLLQLLSLTAMEPPANFHADTVRDEKVKVLNAVRPVPAAEVDQWAVRGQYGKGRVRDQPVPGYREEEGVARDSVTPTYTALRLLIDNWRWQGVPFFLRSGKRLRRDVTEIAIQFREPPHLLFPLAEGRTLCPNVLVIRIQPDEGLSLRFEIKVPGMEVRMTSAELEFSYADAFDIDGHSAYETLLLDAMEGDPTLFVRNDGNEAAWRVVDPVLEAWAADRPRDFPNYAAGEWGPPAGDDLIAAAGAAWRQP
jgi:glucose-6-phosphate 1-dehydrogenase